MAEVKAVAVRVAAAMEEVVATNALRGHVAASWLLWRSSYL